MAEEKAVRPESRADRRDYWIAFGGDPSDAKECYKRYVSGIGPIPTVGLDEECIHVREVLPGEITITLEQLEEIIDDNFDYDSRETTIDLIKSALIAKGILPEGTIVTGSDE